MAENDYPLLVFPKPIPAQRATRSRGGGKVKIPDASRQADRLRPQFQRLQEAMERRSLALQDNPLGLQPEQVLVLETVGSIQNFVKVVRKIQGLEWLGECELDDIVPDHGFEIEQTPDKLDKNQASLFEKEKTPDNRLKGRLFLVMTDQQALRHLCSLFSRWNDNRDEKFPRGLAPLKNAFQYLYTIRPWDVEDRIRETGILEDWQNRLEDGEEIVPFEAELWFRADERRRQLAETQLRDILTSMNGAVIQQCVIPDIAYHAILGRLPQREIQRIVEQPESFRDIRLLQCEDILRLRPVGQCAAPVPEDAAETDTLQQKSPEPPQGTPIVALFDGMPLTGHQLLNRWLIVDDPDGYENDYITSKRKHGTAMSSLICHGDLNDRGEAMRRPLYARPIMKPQSGSAETIHAEAIPEDVLPVDLIHRAVRRLYESENGQPPVAPSVRIINLSVCDRRRPLIREMGAWARLLDWLAWKYHVLFIVSAGNHSRDLKLDVLKTNLHGLRDEERERAVIRAIAADTRNRRLLSPAETLNGLTVGATHEDASSPVQSHRINPFVQPGLPSVISAHGPGYRRVIKPDILLPGGKQFMIEKLGNTHANATLETDYSRLSGQRVAVPSNSGKLDQTMLDRGTSNAAALASRGASFLYDLFERLRQQTDASLPADFDVVLIKTLLVHSAAWRNAETAYTSALKNAQNSHTFKEYLGRFLGYGSIDLPKVMSCTEQRVTVLGFGELDDGGGAEFSLPLPPSLSAVSERRYLTITLAWLSPVNGIGQNYRIAHLWFDTKNEITPDRMFADHRAVQRGTVQHEVLEGQRAVDFQDGDTIKVKINCRADAGDIPAPIRYGVAVTLEVADNVGIPIYQEVRDRLAVPVTVQSASST